MSNKLRDAVIGAAVGDAFGVPYEFKEQSDIKVGDEMIGYGSHGVPAGYWSDDTSMILATVYSMMANDGVNVPDIADTFVSWYKEGNFSSLDYPWGIGNTVARSLNRYLKTGEPVGVGKERDNGNGALMRIIPMAFIDCDDGLIDEVSGITHDHEISKAACRGYVRIAQAMLEGQDWKSLLSYLPLWDNPSLRRIPHLETLMYEDLHGSGYVVDTLECALWSVLHTSNYKDCIKTAVSFGRDTDTIACVAGGLAGILYGIEGMPVKWVETLFDLDWITELCDDCEEALNTRKFTCCLCGKTFYGYGNNPWPLSKNEDDQCCCDCNMNLVVPARISGLQR